MWQYKGVGTHRIEELLSADARVPDDCEGVGSLLTCDGRGDEGERDEQGAVEEEEAHVVGSTPEGVAAEAEGLSERVKERRGGKRKTRGPPRRLISKLALPQRSELISSIVSHYYISSRVAARYTSPSLLRNSTGFCTGASALSLRKANQSIERNGTGANERT